MRFCAPPASSPPSCLSLCFLCYSSNLERVCRHVDTSASVHMSCVSVRDCVCTSVYPLRTFVCEHVHLVTHLCHACLFWGVCVCLKVSWRVSIGGSSRPMSLTGWITVISHYWLPISVLHTPLCSSYLSLHLSLPLCPPLLSLLSSLPPSNSGTIYLYTHIPVRLLVAFSTSSCFYLVSVALIIFSSIFLPNSVPALSLLSL